MGGGFLREVVTGREFTVVELIDVLKPELKLKQDFKLKFDWKISMSHWHGQVLGHHHVS